MTKPQQIHGKWFFIQQSWLEVKVEDEAELKSQETTTIKVLENIQKILLVICINCPLTKVVRIILDDDEKNTEKTGNFFLCYLHCRLRQQQRGKKEPKSIINCTFMS
jgi:hypothetical protein